MRSEGYRLQIWAITLTGIVIYILLGDIMYTGLLLIALVIMFLIGESILNKNNYSDFGTNYLEENQIGGRDKLEDATSDDNSSEDNIRNVRPKQPIIISTVSKEKESLTSASSSDGPQATGVLQVSKTLSDKLKDDSETQKTGSKRFSKISFV